MGTVTLEQINKNIIELRKEVEELKEFIHEDFELADDVKKEVEDSRKRPYSEFVKNHPSQMGGMKRKLRVV